MRRALGALCVLGACAAPGEGGPAAAPNLAGTRWLGVVDGSVERAAVPRLEFLREGRVSGFTGCNLLNGTWRLEGSQVRFGPVATTKRFCVGVAGEIEKRFLAALGEESRAAVERGRLVLTTAAGARFEFTEAPGGY